MRHKKASFRHFVDWPYYFTYPKEKFVNESLLTPKEFLINPPYLTNLYGIINM